MRTSPRGPLVYFDTYFFRGLDHCADARDVVRRLSKQNVRYLRDGTVCFELFQRDEPERDRRIMALIEPLGFAIAVDVLPLWDYLGQEDEERSAAAEFLRGMDGVFAKQAEPTEASFEDFDPDRMRAELEDPVVRRRWVAGMLAKCAEVEATLAKGVFDDAGLRHFVATVRGLTIESDLVAVYEEARAPQEQGLQFRRVLADWTGPLEMSKTKRRTWPNEVRDVERMNEFLNNRGVVDLFVVDAKQHAAIQRSPQHPLYAELANIISGKCAATLTDAVCEWTTGWRRRQ